MVNNFVFREKSENFVIVYEILNELEKSGKSQGL